jgi:hypothetical protein
MFRKMRRKDRQLGNEQAIEILQQGEYGVLSTLGENGYPYGLPLNYIVLDEDIYFHCAMEGQKIDNILYNEKVSLCVVEKSEIKPKEFSTDYSSVIVFGRAMEAGEEERQKALQEFVNKYSPAYLKEGKDYIEKMKENTRIMKIEVVHMTGKARNRKK